LLKNYTTPILVRTFNKEASWRKIQQLGLVPLYNNDDNFRLFCGIMEGLAFLPVPDLTIGIHLLRTLPAFAHVAGSGITVDCSIMYVPNGWWKHRWAAS
jgi:hypothetical protein